jgi:hypothetical protein
MKAFLILLGLSLAVFVTPVQAQQGQPGSVNINGNVFDPVPSQGYGAPPVTRARPARHVRRHHVRSST